MQPAADRDVLGCPFCNTADVLLVETVQTVTPTRVLLTPGVTVPDFEAVGEPVVTPGAASIAGVRCPTCQWEAIGPGWRTQLVVIGAEFEVQA